MQKKNRKSIRLKNYDYAQAGLYFVTICVKRKECIFGEIVDDTMIYSQVGLVADHCWKSIPQHFPNVILHDYIVMPNHVHGVLELKAKSEPSLICKNEFQQLIPQSLGSIVKGYKIGVTKWLRYGIISDPVDLT